MYNELMEVRKESIESLMIFVDKLCNDAQYVVLKYAFSKLLDSCIIEQFIVKMKNLIMLNLKSNHDLGCFQGIRLLEIIQLCSNISVKPGFNLPDNKEYVLSAISLFYFLSKNGIDKLNMGEEFSNVTKQFVDIVQNAIDYSHEQQNLELKILDDNDFREKSEGEIIQGSSIPKLSKNEKQSLLSHMNTTIILVQTNLDMLKSIIEK